MGERRAHVPEANGFQLFIYTFRSTNSHNVLTDDEEDLLPIKIISKMLRKVSRGLRRRSPSGHVGRVKVVVVGRTPYTFPPPDPWLEIGRLALCERLDWPPVNSFNNGN